MDFFERQEQARRRTWWLVVWLAAAVVVMVLAVYAVVAAIVLRPLYTPGGYFLGYWVAPTGAAWLPEALARWYHWKIFCLTAGGTLAIVSGGMLLKRWELRRGGAAVAESLGGRLVASNTTDRTERQLLNVVEEMTIASGVPMPQVYVLDAEEGVNAFAAGFTAADAAIAVTRGALEQLSRDELQGVLAHEFSHLLNGDMRLSTRLISLVAGILCLTLLGRTLVRMSMNWGGMRPRERESRGTGGLLFLGLGLALLVIGSLGAFFARLIKAAVARQRELLADAAAVQFTRNPQGLVDALRKSVLAGTRLAAPNAEEASHLYFCEGVGTWFNLLATHPPIQERLEALQPGAGNIFLEELKARERADTPGAETMDPQEAEALGLVQKGGPVPQAEPARYRPAHSRQASTAENPDARYGPPPEQGLARALGLFTAAALGMDAEAAAARRATREPASAAALVCALLLSDRPEIAQAQRALISGKAPQAIAQAFEVIDNELVTIKDTARLALVELSLPALRQLSPDQFDQWEALLEDLIAADGQIELFEYVLQRLVRHQLAQHFHPPKRSLVPTGRPLSAFPAQTQVLLSVLAHFGAENDSQAPECFAAAAGALGEDASGLGLLPPAACGLPELDRALTALAQLNPIGKRELLAAASAAVQWDGTTTPEEALLLRAIAEALEVPAIALGPANK